MSGFMLKSERLGEYVYTGETRTRAGVVRRKLIARNDTRDCGTMWLVPFRNCTWIRGSNVLSVILMPFGRGSSRARVTWFRADATDAC